MTERQRIFFYFPAWHRCARARDWRMVAGRLVGRREAQFAGGEVNELYQRVWNTAEQLARQQHRAVTADDLRHGCNLVATNGQIVSSQKLSNQQMNRVVALLAVLADPDDMAAMMDWSNPQRSQQRSFVAFLKKKAPEAIIIAIARNASFLNQFESGWDQLPIEKLRWLSSQLKNRRAEKRYVSGPF